MHSKFATLPEKTVRTEGFGKVGQTVVTWAACRSTCPGHEPGWLRRVPHAYRASK
jgi:hypothetical protein